MIAIGCFIKLESSDQELILGNIMTKIQRGKEEITEMYNAKDLNQGGIRAWFRNLFCREYLGAYIMTVGIIDECRRLGLGSMLLDRTILELNRYWIQCEVIYLHVIDYNETAIRFYERNKFSQLKRIKNHYVVEKREYDALVLYKDIKT